jgi:L-2-hydroxyglutarate oxidase LhgO
VSSPDFLVIGAGVIGLSVARDSLKARLTQYCIERKLPSIAAASS